MTRACRNRQWWLAEPIGPGGECRGAPPTPVVTLDGPDAIWPRTGAFMWCGAFRIAEKVIADQIGEACATADPDEAWRKRRGPSGGIADAEFEGARAKMSERLAGVGKGIEQ